MLLLSISKQFLKKLIPIVAVVGVVLGCLGFAFKQEREAQAERNKILEQMNEKYKNYKNGKEYVDEQLDKMGKSAEAVIMKCVEKDEYGNLIVYNKNVNYEAAENIDSVKNTIKWEVEPFDDGQKRIKVVLTKFDVNDKLIYQETRVLGLNKEVLELPINEEQDMTYGDYLNKLVLDSEEILDKYDDILSSIDRNIKILEAYGIRDKNKPEEDVDAFNADDIYNNEMPALKCLAEPIEK